MQVKVGYVVRFLNAVGGGVVKRIVGDIAWIEGEDGFEIPSPISELVVVEKDDTFIPAYKSPVSALNQIKKEPKKETSFYTRTEVERIRPNQQISSRANPLAKLNVYLCFRSQNVQHLMQNPIEAYLVNNSEYSLQFTYANFYNGSWHLIFHDSIEPFTKLFLEDFMPEALAHRSKVAIQFIAFRIDGSYMLKAPTSVEQRLDASRFFKQSSYTESPFFEDNVLSYTLLEDDQPPFYQKLNKDLFASSKKIEGKINEKKISKPNEKQKEPLVVDLHAHKLLDNYAQMEAREILQYQEDTIRRIMELHKKDKGFRIVFIHGKGEGVLRKRVEQIIRKDYPKCKMQDASFLEYGYGATLIHIY